MIESAHCCSDDGAGSDSNREGTSYGADSLRRASKSTTIRTSNTSQETCGAATCYPVQRILLFSLVRNDGLGGSERCTHRSCRTSKKGVIQRRFFLRPTEETNSSPRSGEKSGCAFGVGPQRILHTADESANQGGLHSDSCSILHRWPCLKARGIHWLIWNVCGRHGEQRGRAR